MGLQACETGVTHMAADVLLQHSRDHEIISGSEKMGEKSTALALVLMLSQGRQEEDWTKFAAPSR